MKDQTDKELAVLLMEMRQHEGRARWGYSKKNGWRMVLFINCVLILFALGVIAQS